MVLTSPVTRPSIADISKINVAGVFAVVRGVFTSICFIDKLFFDSRWGSVLIMVEEVALILLLKLVVVVGCGSTVVWIAVVAVAVVAAVAAAVAVAVAAAVFVCSP